MADSSGEPLLPSFPATPQPEQKEPPLDDTEESFFHAMFGDNKRLRTMLIFTCICKGFVDTGGILFLQRTSLCRETLQVGAQKCQAMAIISLLPKSLRGVIALALSSVCHLEHANLWGRMIVVLSIAASVVSLLFLGIYLQVASSAASHVLVGVLVGVVNLGMCVLDIIMQAAYADLFLQAQKHKDAGDHGGAKSRTQRNLVFHISNSWQAGTLLAAVLAGIVIEFSSPVYIFFMAIVPFLVIAREMHVGIMTPVIHDFFKHDSAPEREGSGSFFWKLAVVISLFSVISSLMIMVTDEEWFITSFGVLGFMLILFWNTRWSMNSMIVSDAKEELGERDYPLYSFVILSTIVLYIDISAAEAFFVTADPQKLQNCNRNVPGLSYLEFNTFGAILAALSGWAGTKYEQWKLDHEKSAVFFKRFVSIQALGFLAAGLDNFLPLGVFNGGRNASRIFYFVVYCLVGPFVTQIYWLGIISTVWPKIMPKNKTKIAVPCFMSMVSYASVVSSQIGLLLMKIFRLQDCFDCNFSNLAYLMFVAHVLIPLFTLVPFYELTQNGIERRKDHSNANFFFCIPNAFVCDSLLKKVN